MSRSPSTPPAPSSPAGEQPRPGQGHAPGAAGPRYGGLLARVALLAVVTAVITATVAEPALASTSVSPASAVSVVPVAGALAVKTLPEVITSLTGWVVGILAITATLFLTVGGLRYLIAGGDPGEVEKAKTALKSAAIGYGLALLAPVIVDLLKQVLGA
jgi:hypothetical protein